MGKIQLRQVRKSFGDVHVIPGIDLDIEDGEFVVFVGPSGCGKSTLLRLIAGLEDTSAGTIDIDGRDATNLPPAKRGLGGVEAEPPGIGFAGREAPGLFVGRHGATAPGVHHAVRGTADVPRDLLAGAEAAIDQARGG